MIPFSDQSWRLESWLSADILPDLKTPGMAQLYPGIYRGENGNWTEWKSEQVLFANKNKFLFSNVRMKRLVVQKIGTRNPQHLTLGRTITIYKLSGVTLCKTIQMSMLKCSAVNGICNIFVPELILWCVELGCPSIQKLLSYHHKGTAKVMLSLFVF